MSPCLWASSLTRSEDQGPRGTAWPGSLSEVTIIDTECEESEATLVTRSVPRVTHVPPLWGDFSH